MTGRSVSPPFEIFSDIDGSPLDAGYIYIGTANLNPETNPISVYWDSALTIPAAQPIRTLGGYPVRNGSQARVYCAVSPYSLTVRNKNGSLISSVLEAKDDLSLLAVPTGSSLIGFSHTPAAAAGTVGAKLQQVVDVADAPYNATCDGTADDTAAVQAALDAIESGTELHIGNCKITGYLTITSKTNFRIVMDAPVVPTGTLNNLSTGLFHLTNCSHFSIIPNIVNASYSSTLNCIQLSACTNGEIVNGRIDVKYNTLDGSAGIQLRTDTKRIKILNNYIRSGYGVLVNSGESGVSNITINGNEFVGQTAYGNTGPGDAIEFNTPTNSSFNIVVENNRFSGFTFVNASRAIVCGFAYVYGLIVRGNVFSDITGMIGIHCEEGTSHALVSGNLIQSGHVGVNIACNTTKVMYGISVIDNIMRIPVLDPNATYATGAGIKVATNQVAGGGVIRGLDVSGNDVYTAAVAYNGIRVNDHEQGRICRNRITGFPQVGLTVSASNSGSNGIKHCVIEGNSSCANTTNYSIARGVSGSSTVDTNIFTDVVVRDNIADNASWTLESYTGGPQAYPIYPVARQVLTGNAVSPTDNTAKKIFTITIPNAFMVGQVRVDYNCYNTETANRIQESGSYVFTIGRQSGVVAKIAASSKFGNSQVARQGAGAPTVTIASAAVAGAAGATNTFDIQFTYNLGAVSENNCEFMATYIGNLNTVTIAP